MARMPELIAGRYRVLRPLGRGGMGAVHEVEHVQTGERLALKVLFSDRPSPEVIERFRREALVTARLASEHVLRIVEADTAPELDGMPFLVTELLVGEDLRAVLARRGAFPPAEARDILTDAAEGVACAHAMGVIHRDLKPENLFLHRRPDGSWTVKVLDFGVARELGGDGLTATGDFVGTPHYTPPEQVKGLRGAVGPGVDVWAFALIAVELLTGRSYWTEPSVADVVVKILYEPMRPPGISPAFDAWFMRSCAPEPADRWRTVEEQMQALRAVLP
jgi:eukaryotic-like serine/threonine-protein kinase